MGALVFAVAAIVVVPWSVRNARTFHEFVPVSNSLVQIVDGANCRLTYSGPFLGSWRSTFGNADARGTECFEGFNGSQPGFDEAQAADVSRRDGLHYIRTPPQRPAEGGDRALAPDVRGVPARAADPARGARRPATRLGAGRDLPVLGVRTARDRWARRPDPSTRDGLATGGRDRHRRRVDRHHLRHATVPHHRRTRDPRARRGRTRRDLRARCAVARRRRIRPPSNRPEPLGAWGFRASRRYAADHALARAAGRRHPRVRRRSSAPARPRGLRRRGAAVHARAPADGRGGRVDRARQRRMGLPAPGFEAQPRGQDRWVGAQPHRSDPPVRPAAVVARDLRRRGARTRAAGTRTTSDHTRDRDPDHRLRRGRRGDRGEAGAGRPFGHGRRGRSVGRPGRGRAVLDRRDGAEVPAPGRIGCARLTGHRVRGRPLRRWEHRDQQRPVPPPPPELADEWRRTYRIAEFTPDVLDQYSDEVESELSVSRLPGAPPPSSAALERGAAKLGWRAVEFARVFSYDSAGRGTKQTMARTFLPARSTRARRSSRSAASPG